MFTIRTARTWAVATAAAALCVLVAGTSGARAADGIAAAERRALEQTIRQQLDAFAHDDADRAFGFATPEIQRMFGSPDRFMAMVRERYEPVYRSVGVKFVRIERVAGEWVQTVAITDEAGRVWHALFTMRRLPDKSWKVAGCELEETDAVAI